MAERLSVGQRRVVALNITVNPYKISVNEIEARLEGRTSLLPGQLLRFDAEAPVYGEVTGVRSLEPDGKNGCILRIRVLYGVPNLQLASATLLNDDEMTAEVQRLQQPFEQPLTIGPFTAEFENMGALTLVEGDDFTLKLEALMGVMSGVRAYQRLLIIDPLGVFDGDGMTVFQAGSDVRLSLKAVGSKRFLSAMAETFPDSLTNQGLQVLAGYLPVGSGFAGFDEIVKAASYDHSPMRNLLLQSLQSAQDVGVFADSEEQALDFARLSADGISVVDLSALSEPWKTLFYEELCLQIFEQAGADLMPVLVYPENYLPDVEGWVQKADEGELRLLILTSPYPDEALQTMANNLIVAEGINDIRMEGDLTLGLPVAFGLEGTAPDISASVPAYAAPETDTEPVAELEAASGDDWKPVADLPMSALIPGLEEPPVDAGPQPDPAWAEVPAPPVENTWSEIAPEQPIPHPGPEISTVETPTLEPDFPIPPPPEAEAAPPEAFPATAVDEDPGFESILGQLPPEAEPADFDFDLNLDSRLDDPAPAADAGLPSAVSHSLEEFASPAPTVEAPPATEIPASMPAYTDPFPSMPAASAEPIFAPEPSVQMPSAEQLSESLWGPPAEAPIATETPTPGVEVPHGFAPYHRTAPPAGHLDQPTDSQEPVHQQRRAAEGGNHPPRPHAGRPAGVQLDLERRRQGPGPGLAADQRRDGPGGDAAVPGGCVH